MVGDQGVGKETRTALLKVRLKPGVKDKWNAYCKALGVTPSKAISSAIEKQIGSVIDASAQASYKPVKVDFELKAQIDEYCKAAGIRVDRFVAAALREHLAKNARASAAIGSSQESRPGEEKVRFEIRLTKSEKEAVDTRSKEERCSATRWVVDSVRYGLTREPQFGTREVDALWDSNYKLLTIGRNLNQIARKINDGAKVKLTVEHIQKLSAAINEHTSKVNTAVRASIDRWTIA